MYLIRKVCRSVIVMLFPTIMPHDIFRCATCVFDTRYVARPGRLKQTMRLTSGWYECVNRLALERPRRSSSFHGGQGNDPRVLTAVIARRASRAFFSADVSIQLSIALAFERQNASTLRIPAFLSFCLSRLVKI